MKPSASGILDHPTKSMRREQRCSFRDCSSGGFVGVTLVCQILFVFIGKKQECVTDGYDPRETWI